MSWKRFCHLLGIVYCQIRIRFVNCFGNKWKKTQIDYVDRSLKVKEFSTSQLVLKMYLLVFVLASQSPWLLIGGEVSGAWLNQGAPMCVSAHACELVCAFIPLLNMGELWEWCPWFVICQVWMCVLPVSAVVFVGMQQEIHSIVGHVSSVIACREPPRFSMWKINGLLFVSLSILPSCFSHSRLKYWGVFCFFSPDLPEHLHIKKWIGEDFCNSHYWCDAFWGTFEYNKNDINLSEHKLWL